jgi:hypothetical protein
MQLFRGPRLVTLNGGCTYADVITAYDFPDLRQEIRFGLNSNKALVIPSGILGGQWQNISSLKLTLWS